MDYTELIDAFKNHDGTNQKSMANPEVYDAFKELIELRKESLLGRFLVDLLKLLKKSLDNSEQFKKQFLYWKTEIKHNQVPSKARIPRKWHYFIKFLRTLKPNITIKSAKLMLMFVIESALLFLSDIILLKICLEYKIFDIGTQKDLLKQLDDDKDQYTESVFFPVNLILRYLRKRFKTINVDEKTYYWWTNTYRYNGNHAAEGHEDILLELNARIINIIRTISEYKFTDMDDLLGDLYQTYFNDDTRRALGEFYTDNIVVERILNDVGYTIGKGLTEQKLLDPACGSGSFISEATLRYFKSIEKSEKTQNWRLILTDFCKNGRVVGFDINPFACLMSANRLIMDIIPYLSKALSQDPDYELPQLPIFQTDSLLLENDPQIPFKQKSFFDFVVGNPPFVRVTKIPKKHRKFYLNSEYESAKSRINLYILFIERSISRKIGFLKKNGKFGFIMPTSFMVYEGYGRKIRQIIFRDTKILRLMNFSLCSKEVFSQDVSTSILILQRSPNNLDYFTSIIIKNMKNFSDLLKIKDKERISSEYDVYRVNTKYLIQNPFDFRISKEIISPFYSDKIYEILCKLCITSNSEPADKKYIRLEELISLNQGIRIGSREVRKLVIKTSNEYNKITPPKKKEKWRPLINSSETEKYQIKWKERYLKFHHENDTEKLYLPKSDKRKASMESELSRPTIFMNNTGQYLRISCDFRDDVNYYPLNTLYYMVMRDSYEIPKSGFSTEKDLITFILAYLNSIIVEFWYRCNYWALSIPGGSIKYREIIKDLPVFQPKYCSRNEQQIVERILTLTRQIVELTENEIVEESQLNDLRNEIDDCFFDLFNFTGQEINIMKRFLHVYCPKGSY